MRTHARVRRGKEKGRTLDEEKAQRKKTKKQGEEETRVEYGVHAKFTPRLWECSSTILLVSPTWKWEELQEKTTTSCQAYACHS
mmetsp:Transcript_28563/g.62123  ORF Transcript_28563/g.62123 Transcript_28563/m.62123 type:complete len:84 (+) Transcript_28563:188-439(+)